MSSRDGTPVRHVRTAVAAAAVVAVLAAWLGIGVRATEGGHAAVDEPEYLLSALSLWEDRDLDISDELAAQRWRDFHDAELPQQVQPRADGSAVSPHDPLLPILLAVPVGVGGWVGAKLALGLLAGLLAGLTTWVAICRFAVPAVVAGVGTSLAAASAPLAVYGQQVYPEVSAALAVTAAVAALTGPLRRGGLVLLGVAVVALPWLGVKYAPVAATLALIGVVRLVRAGRTRAAVGLGVGLGLLGAVYLGMHRVVYGGWTVYAAGDHFRSTGELAVVGTDPDYLGRSLRLVALLVDDAYGLVVWQPAWLLVAAALGALLVARPAGWVTLVAPLAVGWATATWIALTMHGFWWPGRQVVIVLPLALLAVLWWCARLRPASRLAAGGLAVAGVVTYGWLVADGLAGRFTWVADLVGAGGPVASGLSWLLPDYRIQPVGFWALHVGWVLALVAIGLAAALAEHRRPRTDPAVPARRAPDRDPVLTGGDHA